MNPVALVRKALLCAFVTLVFACLGNARAANAVPVNLSAAYPYFLQSQDEELRPLRPTDIAPIADGAIEITASNANIAEYYQAWDLPKGTHVAVMLEAVQAQVDGTLDFKSLAHKVAAGDIILIVPSQPWPPGEIDFRESGVTVSAPASTGPDKYPTVIVGYQQSGANNADSSGRLYVDVYYGHTLSDTHPVLNRTRMFSNVRVASGAQNASSTVGSYVAGLAGSANSLQLNQVASIAEGLAGLDYALLQTSDKNNRFAFFMEYGAQGALQSAELNNTFAFPAYPTQAWLLLVAAEAAQQKALGITNAPTITSTCVTSTKIPGVADNCMFVEFAQQQPFFNQEAYLGLKYAYHVGATLSPGTISIGAGANNAVNQKMDFNALRLDGTAPFPIPIASGGAKPAIPVIYFFGYANLAFNHKEFPKVNNFIPLNPISSVVYNNLAQTPSSSNTYVIPTMPQRQEFYSIGIGVNLTDAWNTIFGSKKD